MSATTTGLAARIATGSYMPGPYHLPNGTVLPSFFDPFRLAADPELLAETAAALADLLPTDTGAVAGPALAAVPLVTALSLHTGLPATFLRPQVKAHGSCRRIEGADVGHRHIVVVDDTARTGTSLLHATRLLRIAGATVTTAVCVVDRQAGATDLLAAQHLELRALVTDPGGTP
ncbi:orotate phosphoribosyltransferase [Actinacidiphila rubida]|uniref:Orotate phosphoribosyltransferase n=1 Tax=Actinacidiphila rubida TaxID=310780 RepID=A0A1H8S7D8_9ACTN|nr:phosphoribosyltransferase family protein [Actinacidiphila rubida]SEO74218.1 orotate phosphoribosyltransferase [Actinacidiphila rubida]